MRFDLHCHVKGGSIDSHIRLRRWIHLLSVMGYDGMMISDHDSYRACRLMDSLQEEFDGMNFTVLRGLEYDTRDAGHFLVVMPDKLYLKVLNVRGMRVERLVQIVHSNGGVLGPAHPYGVRSSSAMLFRYMSLHADIINEFDFIESFNVCESPISNRLAKRLAEKFGKLCTAGSDAHDEKYVGLAYTDIDADIRCNNDFIKAVHEHADFFASGIERRATVKSKMKDSPIGVLGFRMYNRGLSAIFKPYRKHHIKKTLRKRGIVYHKGKVN